MVTNPITTVPLLNGRGRATAKRKGPAGLVPASPLDLSANQRVKGLLIIDGHVERARIITSSLRIADGQIAANCKGCRSCGR
jgi:hypothetical protein